jgi:bifunctional DNA-binding transcriptional regulator/antitoxin component of YhaV-PrlF toxin-antitoxin module
MAQNNFDHMRITLDKISRLVLPKALLNQLALKPGDKLKLILEDDGFKLRVEHPSSPLIEDNGILVCSSRISRHACDLEIFSRKQTNQRTLEIGCLSSIGTYTMG